MPRACTVELRLSLHRRSQTAAWMPRGFFEYVQSRSTGRMRSTLLVDDLAVAHRNHAVGPLQRIGTMRNQNRRNVLKKVVETTQHKLLRRRIQSGGAFIQNQDPRTL